LDKSRLMDILEIKMKKVEGGLVGWRSNGKELGEKIGVVDV
jgi:hypothetical protein